jgi:hypothetical protein
MASFLQKGLFWAEIVLLFFSELGASKAKIWALKLASGFFGAGGFLRLRAGAVMSICPDHGIGGSG